MRLKESSLVRNIVKVVRAKYPKAYIRKLADRYSRGLPDLLIILTFDNHNRALTFFVETKTKKGRLSKLQKKEMKEIFKAGGIAIVSRSVEEVIDQLANWEMHHRRLSETKKNENQIQ